MRPLYPASKAKELDISYVKSTGLKTSMLIDGASREAFIALRDHLISKKVLFLVGPGNNGSDGLEIARLLSKENQNVSLFYLSDSGNEENLRRRERVSYLPRAFGFNGYDVIVDALFGTSFESRDDGYLHQIINEVNDAGAFIISIDMPSADIVNADITIALMCHKLELYHPLKRSGKGRIMLGYPVISECESATSLLFDIQDCSLKPMDIGAYKNKRGHVAIIGGSDKYPGAPILSALSSFHSGSGLVSLHSSKRVLDAAFSSYPSIMRSDLSDIDSFSAILLGPGWDLGDESILDLAINSGKKLCVDADAIKLLKGRKLGYNGVITPHIGEYRALCSLLSIDDGLESAESLRASLMEVSRRLECIVVLKSSTLWIADKDKLYVFDGVNPSLGVAGSGDVLSGIILSLLGQGVSPLEAALNGVILHQEAGRRARERYGYYSAEELIKEISR